MPDNDSEKPEKGTPDNVTQIRDKTPTDLLKATSSLEGVADQNAGLIVDTIMDLEHIEEVVDFMIRLHMRRPVEYPADAIGFYAKRLLLNNSNPHNVMARKDVINAQLREFGMPEMPVF